MQRILFTLISLIVIIVSVDTACAEERSALFPLGRSGVGDRELPKAFGVSLTVYHQEQDYNLKSLEFSLPGVDPAQLSGILSPPLDLNVENTTDEINLQLDCWVLPFLNVFGIIGRVDGETKVEMEPPLEEITVDYDGLLYGAGLTLAAGGERFFGSLTAVFTSTNLEQEDSSVKAWVFMPRVGIRSGLGQFWIGAMYQQAEEEHSGTETVPLVGNVLYDVELEEEEAWNFLAGMKIDFNDNWKLNLEGGFGKRKQATVSLIYRF